MHQKIITAKYIMPYPGKVLTNHYITIVDGVITGVQKFHTMRTSGTQSEFVSLGNAVLMPGFVNAHTHIELGEDERDIKAQDYSSLLNKIHAQQKKSIETKDKNIAHSVEKLTIGGTTTVGDFARSASSAEAIINKGLRGVIFIEISSLKATNISKNFNKAQIIRNEIIELQQKQNESQQNIEITSGLAPIAPHSASEGLYAKCMSQCLTEGIGLSTHFSTHPDENRLFQTGDGLFYDFHKNRYPDLELNFPPAISSLRYINSVYEENIRDEELAIPPLFIHGNYIDTDDARILRKMQAVVVHCPYHHNFFEFDKYPFELYKKFGIPVAIGTNSALIHKSLSMLEEIRLLAKYNISLPNDEILRMSTINGAIGLNLSDEIGVLAENKRADIIAIELSRSTTSDRVTDDIIYSNSNLLLNMTNGKILYNAC